MQVILDVIYKPAIKPIVVSGERVKLLDSEEDEIKLMRFTADTVDYLKEEIMPYLDETADESL